MRLSYNLVFTVLQVFGCICDLHKRARLEGMLREEVEAQAAGEGGPDLTVCFIQSILLSILLIDILSCWIIFHEQQSMTLFIMLES